MRARLLLTAASTAAGLLLTGCGGDDSTAVTSSASDGATDASTGATDADGPAGTITFPAEFGLPDLTVPDDARVIDYQVGDAANFEVTGIDRTEVLDSMQAELEDAGFQVVRTDGDDDLQITSVTASKDGAGTVLVQASSADAVTVIGNPPA